MIRKAKLFQEKHDMHLDHVMSKEEFNGHGRMFAKVTLEEGGEVAWHTHTDEIEYYYVLSGHGIFTDSEKKEFAVGENDVCLMTPQGGHAIRNDGKEPLVFMALIINL